VTGHDSARDQVARYLRAAQLLLILDNFEHLLAEAPWLGELLAVAPGLRLLVTSREALNLREEWRYPLAGLAVPSEETDDPGQVEAVRLFMERAQQVRRDFSLSAEQVGNHVAIRLLPLLTAPPAADPAHPVPPPSADAGVPTSPTRSDPARLSPLPEPLSARELAVLRLIAAGHSNREIADELYLAVNTVRSYSQQLYGKLGVGSRTQAVARARELGLIA
jgi:DNA-binding CsgD family transcriptional regulator